MPRSTLNSQTAFAKAQEVMPGGVSSPVRAFKAVGGTPLFIKEGEKVLVHSETREFAGRA